MGQFYFVPTKYFIDLKSLIGHTISENCHLPSVDKLVRPSHHHRPSRILNESELTWLNYQKYSMEEEQENTAASAAAQSKNSFFSFVCDHENLASSNHFRSKKISKFRGVRIAFYTFTSLSKVNECVRNCVYRILGVGFQSISVE